MSNTLTGGEFLTPGQELKSENGKITMTLQTDGNFVLYNGSNATWSSDTQGKPSAKVIMQKGGNLEVQDADGNVLWGSGTVGEPGDYLKVQNDGNAVIYIDGGAIWATNTYSG